MKKAGDNVEKLVKISLDHLRDLNNDISKFDSQIFCCSRIVILI